MLFTQFGTVLLYLLLCFISFLLAYLAEKKNKYLFIFILALIYTLIAGLRGFNVGIDTASYIFSFETGQYAWGPYKGFIIFTDLFYGRTSSTFYLLSVSAISYFLILTGIWMLRGKLSLTFTIIFYFMCMFLPSLNIIKQHFALSFIVFGLPFLLKRHYVVYILLCFLASTIHIASALGFIILFVHLIYTWKERSASSKMLIILSLLIFIIIFVEYFSVSFTKIVTEKYLFYFSDVSLTFGLFGIIKLVFGISFIWYSFNSVCISHKNDYRFFCLIGLAAFLGELLGYFFTFMNRFTYVFVLFEYICFSWLWKNTSQNHQVFDGKYNLVFKMIAFLICAYPFVSILIRDGYGVMNYSIQFLS